MNSHVLLLLMVDSSINGCEHKQLTESLWAQTKTLFFQACLLLGKKYSSIVCFILVTYCWAEM